MASCCQNPAPRAQQAWAVGGSMGSAGPSAGRPVLVPFPSLADAWLYAAASRPNGGGGALLRDAVTNMGQAHLLPAVNPLVEEGLTAPPNL